MKLREFFTKVMAGTHTGKSEARAGKTDARAEVVKELTQAMDEANAVPPTDKDIPKVLVPILGQANRTFRRRWIKHNRKLWDDAWRYQKLQEEIAAKGAVVIKP